jgi:hypothetical protein
MVKSGKSNYFERLSGNSLTSGLYGTYNALYDALINKLAHMLRVVKGKGAHFGK